VGQRREGSRLDPPYDPLPFADTFQDIHTREDTNDQEIAG
jgi:hypothetical protein